MTASERPNQFVNAVTLISSRLRGRLVAAVVPSRLELKSCFCPARRAAKERELHHLLYTSPVHTPRRVQTGTPD